MKKIAPKQIAKSIIFTALGAAPGIIWFCNAGTGQSIIIACLGAFVAFGLSLPGVSMARVAGGTAGVLVAHNVPRSMQGKVMDTFVGETHQEKLESDDDQPREIKIETSDGEGTAHQTRVNASPQKVNPVEGDDLAMLQSMGSKGPEFVSHYVPGVTEPTLKDYDEAFRSWQFDYTPPYDDQKVVQIIGGYLGNKCIADFDMEWVIVTDEYGTDFAVCSKEVKLMSFPFSTVLKRIEDHEFNFVEGVYYSLKEMLSNGEYKTR